MADDDKEKETTPPTPPENDPPTAPDPTPPSNDNDGLREEMTELKGIVTGLVEAVAALAPLPQDQQPVSVPWTHKTF